MKVRIALVGDYTPEAKAHQAIPIALALAGTAMPCECEWIHTSTLLDDPREQFGPFQGIWLVPATPYANTRGALGVIRFAREAGRPFLGTCGGFQHALLECAESLWNIEAPAHAEMDPTAPNPLVAPLMCSLVEEAGEILLEPGSRLAAIYGVPSVIEGYHCRYGLNPLYAEHLRSGPLRIGARDASGDVRAVELRGHPFFFGTLYQPERSALEGRKHPLVMAFVAAASAIEDLP